MDARLDDFLSRCLLLDLETGPNGEIHKIGAVRGDRSFLRQGRFDERAALAELEGFAGDAELALGHNLLGHDLHALRAREPALRLLRLRVVDTLFVSPLAFPENPYHRLVKDYKLVRDAVSDPVSDCRLAHQVFREQWAELGRRAAAGDLGLLALYRFCFRGATGLESAATGGNGVSLVFAALGAELPEVRPALALLHGYWDGLVCRTAAPGLALRYFSDPRLRPAVAYATAWLRVAGARSVLPPWVRHRFPDTLALLHGLRDRPCDSPDCMWCRTVHDPRGQLKRWFGLDGFRPQPRLADGEGLQGAIVAHGMGGGSHLGILPTGGGKSLCFQLPALVRYLRRGELTVVVSPLQALMKDQVDNLQRNTGTINAAALYGMLTGPERGEVLERVRLGEVAILYVSPEQLRNRSCTQVLESREIGCWVFDEAHCLSKWGHDFRPDYLYAARFVRELAGRQGVPVPPVACFTATAKIDVIEEILAHFQSELGLGLRLFQGGTTRDNLVFEVWSARKQEKEARLLAVLAAHLGEPRPIPGPDLALDRVADPAPGTGAAVVYAGTRARVEELAALLRDRGWAAQAFHAGMAVTDKRAVQDAFIGGALQVVCATNAFGMGVDKDDVRLVVHVDIPGSLENYVQEAGRAGRDQAPATCVLLYDEQDAEQQFKLASGSQLSRADIAEILRAIRRARPDGDGLVVLTTGELLHDEALRVGFDTEGRDADTRVRTAIAWLERAGFVERNENRTRVFQGRPAVPDLETGAARIAGLGLSAPQRARWLAVLEALFNCDPDGGLTADELAGLPAFRPPPQTDPAAREPVWDRGESSGQRVLRTLHDMAKAGLLRQGPQHSALLRHKVVNPSTRILAQVCEVERAMIAALREEAPDADNGQWYPLSIRRLNQRLRDRELDSNPELLRDLLASLARDGRGLAASRGSLEFRQRERDYYLVRLHRDWSTLEETARRRQAAAAVVLAALIAKLPAQSPAGAEVPVAFGLDDLTEALGTDLELRSQIRDPLAAAERALLFLHDHRAIVLQGGVGVFRQAMTLRLLPESRRKRYTLGHFAPLARHYGERVFQIHAMDAYARLGLEKIARAIALAMDYFALDRKSFVRRYFPDRREVLERATTAESFRRIVDSLDNPDQIAIVAAPPETNRLVLAGPGSGKTRVIVHRCAYLLRVLRVDPRAILILCYNRSAALDLRRRLAALVDADARGVTVQTYHGFAMRLVGASFAERAERGQGGNGQDAFEGLIQSALDLLEGRAQWSGVESDTLRDRLLAGYRHILVDEYQDIDAAQYRMVRAISGMPEQDGAAPGPAPQPAPEPVLGPTRPGDPDGDGPRLALLAVGDDDQNIYAFRGASVGFIRRFQTDYQAEIHHLIESYRSTAHICAAANALIAHNRDRMKTGQPIRVDRHRRHHPPGGPWERLDPRGRGRVEILEVPDPGRQAAALTARMKRLHQLGGGDWSDFAVLAFRHETLVPIRALCEHAGIPVAWRGELPPLHRVREIAAFLDALAALGRAPVGPDDLLALVPDPAPDPDPDRTPAPAGATPWRQVLADLIADWRTEAGEAQVAAGRCLEFCYESLGEQRRDRTLGQGVLLATLHGAKGLEFRHVLIADGEGAQAEPEELRRLYYVGMTRARETLALGRLRGGENPDPALFDGDWLVRAPVDLPAPAPGILGLRYDLLTPADIDLGFAGRRPPNDPIHARIAALPTGARLTVRAEGETVWLCDRRGETLARLSRRAAAAWLPRVGCIAGARVVAWLRRRRDDGEPEYRDSCRCEVWEYPLAELEWRADGSR